MQKQLEALGELKEFFERHSIRHLIRQGDNLDQDYILDWLAQFAEALERPELRQRYRDLVEKTKKTG